MNKIFNVLKQVYLLIFSKDYFQINSKESKWAFISYLSEPFFKTDDDNYFLKHQNRREALILAQVYYDRGFNVHVRRFDKPIFLSKRKYDVVFGLEPNFEIMARKNPLALKIYYATGAFWEYQNQAIIERTKFASDFYNYRFKERRLSKPHNACVIADCIFQIGTKNTISTYPENLKKKIKIIRQTNTVHSINLDLQDKFLKYKKNEFLWFGSSGTILKGLDLILPIFKDNAGLKLNIIGSLDEDFKVFFEGKFSDVKQIVYHDYLSINSPELYEIALNCTFIIFPSCTEGLPGSVINMMGLGLIPIVSQVSAVDGIEDLGFIVQLNTSSIKEVIDQSQVLEDEQIKKMMELNVSYIKNNYNMTNFESDLKLNVKECLLGK